MKLRLLFISLALLFFVGHSNSPPVQGMEGEDFEYTSLEKNVPGLNIQVPVVMTEMTEFQFEFMISCWMEALGLVYTVELSATNLKNTQDLVIMDELFQEIGSFSSMKTPTLVNRQFLFKVSCQGETFWPFYTALTS